MKDRIGQLMAEVAAAEFSGADEVEAFRVAYLGRKGKMKDLMAAFKEVPGDQKRELGPMLNALKQAVEDKVKAASTAGRVQRQGSGLTPRVPQEVCPRHPPPLQVVRREIVDIFQNMGFAVAEGPEIEDDWHVFSGLNFPPEHPAATCRTRSSWSEIQTCCCAPTPVRSRCVRWKSASRPCG